MNKLREQIAQRLRKYKGACECEGCVADSLVEADAILALLQPRLLTKDEAWLARLALVDAGYAESFMGCRCPEHTLMAKLKAIQEEDSE